MGLKDPEAVTRIEYMGRVETAINAAKRTLDIAPYAYVVPIDHPLATAMGEAKLALAKCEVLAAQMMKALKR